jgi:L,D-transpeptidase-like protein
MGAGLAALLEPADPDPRPGTETTPAKGGRALPDPEAVGPDGGPVYTLARVLKGARLALRNSPGGRLVKRVGSRTEFGSFRVLWVAAVEDGWLGAPTSLLPNGRLAWFRPDADAVRLERTRYSIHADLSGRVVEFRLGARAVRRTPVTIGAAGTDTPVGRFSVTDKIVPNSSQTFYGCCIVATSGHQPSLPPGWIGGDRIAIHGTPGPVGGAASAGCLRAPNPDALVIFRRAPLGTPVFIRA